jgi:hypothetical protein
MKKVVDILVTLFALGIMMPFFMNWITAVMNTTGYTTVAATDNFIAVFGIQALPWLIPFGFVIFQIIKLTRKDDDDRNIRNI